MNTDAVVVTYYPDAESLGRLLGGLAGQVRRVYLADNTPETHDVFSGIKAGNVSIINMGGNSGIAAAQNAGIRAALADGADFIVLSDDDTEYPEGYVRSMLKVFDTADDIAAAAPLFRDVTGDADNDGFVETGGIGFRKFYPESGLHEIFHAIASGLVLNARLLKDTGLMDEKLFIDWVDFEWCWRARSRGFRLVGNADVTITHRLGDSAVNAGIRSVNLRSPLRHYYITRNAFHLALRCRYLTPAQRVSLFFRSFRYIVGYPILSKPHLTHLRYVLRGLADGLAGKL